MTKLTATLVGIFLVTMFGLLFFGRYYLSQQAYLIPIVGLPLVYSAVLVVLILTGNRRLNQILDGKPVRKVAKGWIALGDIAISPFIAAGSFAVGPIVFGAFTCGFISIGCIALGGLAFAGVAVGALAVGGVAVGWWALGGAAIGWQATLGATAVVREYALGGAAMGHEANTVAARDWFTCNQAFQIAQSSMNPTLWIYLCVPIAIICLVAQRMIPSTAEDGVPFTRGWIMECPKCNYAKPLPGIRAAALSYQKRSFGYCPRCKRLRFIAIRHIG